MMKEVLFETSTVKIINELCWTLTESLKCFSKWKITFNISITEYDKVYFNNFFFAL